MVIPKCGDIVSTRYGKGEIKATNNTYSVPLYMIELMEGRFKGDTLALTELELEKVSK